jgi:hypothetical protein
MGPESEIFRVVKKPYANKNGLLSNQTLFTSYCQSVTEV